MSAAQPFLPFTERSEEKGASHFHFLLVGMNIIHMPAERRLGD